MGRRREWEGIILAFTFKIVYLMRGSESREIRNQEQIEKEFNGSRIRVPVEMRWISVSLIERRFDPGDDVPSLSNFLSIPAQKRVRAMNATLNA